MSLSPTTIRPRLLKELPHALTFPKNSRQTIFTTSLQTTKIHIPENVTITFIALLQKGWQELQKIHFNFEGKNSTLNFLAFIIGRQQEKFPFETISHHQVPRTNAYYHLRSILFDQSEVDFIGNLVIKPKAQLTDAYLAHHTLMLSKDAKVKTIPSLEIEADDVKAGHAATIGNIDEDLLFYLRSRGLEKNAAKELLIKSFLENDLKKIPNEKIRKMLNREIEALHV